MMEKNLNNSNDADSQRINISKTITLKNRSGKKEEELKNIFSLQNHTCVSSNSP